jgi:hypothetical protein
MFDLISKINELEMSYLESLWNLLNLRKSILLTEHGQVPFDQLDEEYKELKSLRKKEKDDKET